MGEGSERSDGVGRTPEGVDPVGEKGVDEGVPSAKASEPDSAEDVDQREDDVGGAATSPLRRTVAGAAEAARGSAAGVARGSVAGVARGSAAATRGRAALAGRASRVTYWPAQLCVLGAILLQIRLPGKLVLGPTWLLPSLEGALLIAMAATTPRGRAEEDHPVRRRVAIGLVALVNVANAVSLYLLAHELLNHKFKITPGHNPGRALILSGVVIWLTNVLIFALWYWLIDRGGPANRARHPDPTTLEGHPDFVFPEMDGGRPYTPGSWMPGFIDYLALALTTATAFSPTDTMPNSRLAKALMSTQALISLITLGLIISRAVGILQ
jgi:hypothetical protein